MSYATRTDLAALLGRSIAAEEEAKADKVLELVDVAIDAHLETRVVAAGILTAVATLSARRMFNNPDGVRNEVLGDWQTAYAPGEILSTDEKTILNNSSTGSARSKMGSPKISADVWADTNLA
jgi:hypothetical protein